MLIKYINLSNFPRNLDHSTTDSIDLQTFGIESKIFTTCLGRTSKTIDVEALNT